MDTIVTPLKCLGCAQRPPVRDGLCGQCWADLGQARVLAEGRRLILGDDPTVRVPVVSMADLVRS